MSEWISVKDRMPDVTFDDSYFYTYCYGKVRDDQWYSAFPRECDGYGNKCKGKCFYEPNMDSDYNGEYKSRGVTHWMIKPKTILPEPPKDEL